MVEPAPVIIAKAYLMSKGMKQFMGYSTTLDENSNQVFWLRGSIVHNKTAIRAFIVQYPDTTVSTPELVTRSRKKLLRRKTLRKIAKKTSV